MIVNLLKQRQTPMICFFSVVFVEIVSFFVIKNV